MTRFNASGMGSPKEYGAVRTRERKSPIHAEKRARRPVSWTVCKQNRPVSSSLVCPSRCCRMRFSKMAIRASLSPYPLNRILDKLSPPIMTESRYRSSPPPADPIQTEYTRRGVGDPSQPGGISDLTLLNQPGNCPRFVKNRRLTRFGRLFSRQVGTCRPRHDSPGRISNLLKRSGRSAHPDKGRKCSALNERLPIHLNAHPSCPPSVSDAS